MIVRSAEALAATTDISTRASSLDKSTTIVVRVGNSFFQNVRYASFIGPKSDAARMNTSTDTTRSSEDPARANDCCTCWRMFRVCAGTSPRSVGDTPLMYMSWPLRTPSGIGELYWDSAPGTGEQLLDLPPEGGSHQDRSMAAP